MDKVNLEETIESILMKYFSGEKLWDILKNLEGEQSEM